jgi:hypothetical protein
VFFGIPKCCVLQNTKTFCSSEYRNFVFLRIPKLCVLQNTETFFSSEYRNFVFFRIPKLCVLIPKLCVPQNTETLCSSEYHTTDTVQTLSSAQFYTPSSGLFRIYLYWLAYHVWSKQRVHKSRDNRFGPQ